MSHGGPQLALLARLSEAMHWNEAVRKHETDPWSYMRRKLCETEGPLRAYKHEVFENAKTRLMADLGRPSLTPAELATHKEAFEALLTGGDYADLAFNLDGEPKSRREGAASVFRSAKAPILFDYEILPPERRSRAWEKRIEAIRPRLDLDRLTRIAERDEMTPAKKARLARRLRRNLGEYLSVTRGEGALRDEITPFMLARIEAAVAAALRLLNRWR
ncbi:MAG TPA: hypothetical protein VN915_17625 [Elusimicrobiota bacterium]|nr:hypothetical protein [Elusimicrobiota bacterium]